MAWLCSFENKDALYSILDERSQFPQVDASHLQHLIKSIELELLETPSGYCQRKYVQELTQFMSSYHVDSSEERLGKEFKDTIFNTL